MDDSEYKIVADELPHRNPVTLRFQNLRLCSSGVFGNVYRGTLVSPEPRREIALKKTWPDFDKENRRINLELNILLGLSRERHKNIIQALYTFRSLTKDDKVCESMVFEYMPMALSTIVKELGGKRPNYLDIKLYTWQLFNGLMFLFHNHICHRDIKPQNLLVQPVTGNLKIADFGSAKIMKRHVPSTSYQVTRFYRPPELLLEATLYSPYVDVWSGGCVYGELVRGSVLFPGRDSKNQLKLIVDTLGPPNDRDISEMKANARIECGRSKSRGFKTILPYASPESIALLERILVYRPKLRLCNTTLLMDPFFDDLFVPGKQRKNGSFISNIITVEDLSIIWRQSKSARRKSVEKMEPSESSMTKSLTSKTGSEALP